MITDALLAAYSWWRWRPHCRPGRHVLLCRLVMPLLDDKPCPRRDLPRAPGTQDRHRCDPGRPWPPR
jgi:hypothetical protein